MTRSTHHDARGLSGWLLPGFLLAVAAVLLVGTLVIQGSLLAGPSPTPTATQRDEHEIITDEGVVSIRYDGETIVVRLMRQSTTIELGRTEGTFFLSAPPGGTPVPTGTSVFVMLCRAADEPSTRRYVFGRFDDTLDLEYTGPDAIGTWASDGLYLFALVPGAIEPGDRIEIYAEGGSVGVPASSFDEAPDIGRPQASGCYVAG
jgi:hypothetical protein